MDPIPFLKPNLVSKEAYAKYFEQIDNSHIYSNYGPLNTSFENRVVSEYFGGTGAAVTVANATLGLMTAIIQAKRTGKYAIMPSFTFAATPLAAMWCGLTPYFLDVDESTWMLDPEQVKATIKKLGDDVAVVVPYATFGDNLDLSYYTGLHTSGIPVVVDAAASFGARPDGKSHFGIRFPGTVVFSFHATKSFGVGEGGLVYSGDTDLITKIRQAGNFGFSMARESVTMGFNTKMSEYTAAISLATLDCYPGKVTHRQESYQHYLSRLESHNAYTLGWSVQQTTGTIPHQFFPLLCPKTNTNHSYIDKLSAVHVQARTYFSPACHQQKQFSQCPSDQLTVTNELSNRILSLPLYEGITVQQIEYIVESLV
jgi:dTDP-4-amino-4,6-dideoxygalactose transaminase